MEENNKTDKIIKDLEIKNEIVALEKFYVDGQINNLPALVEERKNQVIQDIFDYKFLHTVEKRNKDGEVTSSKLNITPYITANYFFKSITNLQNIEPQYSGEQLSILWDLYSEIVMQVNINLTQFTPTLSHFCKFIGITSSGFKKMKNSSDEGIKTMANKIIDSLYDGSVTMAELGEHNARASIYRMKSELERTEKEQPQVTINATTIDLNGINKRINELSIFNGKVRDMSDEQ